MVQMPVWSEYKVTFSQSNTFLDFLFSKGYYPSEMNLKHFMFDPFQNYKSCDLETSHIGFLRHTKEIIYITEERFDAINIVLSDITPDALEYAFSRQNKGQEQDTVVILKRGISMRFIGNHFRFRIDSHSSFGHIDFDPLRGDEKMCRLDLFKFIEDERVGWISLVNLDSREDAPEVSHEDVLNAAIKRNIVKTAVDKFKMTYYEAREDIKHREIRNGWLN